MRSSRVKCRVYEQNIRVENFKRCEVVDREQKKQRFHPDRIENLRRERSREKNIKKTTRKPVDWRAEKSLERSK